MTSFILSTEGEGDIPFEPGVPPRWLKNRLPGGSIYFASGNFGIFVQQVVQCTNFVYYKWSCKAFKDETIQVTFDRETILLHIPVENSLTICYNDRTNRATPGQFNFLYWPERTFLVALEKDKEYSFVLVVYNRQYFYSNILHTFPSLHYFIDRIDQGKPTFLLPTYGWIPKQTHSHILEPETIAITPGYIRRYLDELISLITFGLLFKADQLINNADPVDTRVQEYVAQAKTEIDRRIPDSIQAADLARKIGVNKTQLNQWFKLVIGTTIHQYYMDERFARSERMLEAGKSIKEIAAKYYRSNPSRFINLFKEKHGYPPGAVKKSKKVV